MSDAPSATPGQRPTQETASLAAGALSPAARTSEMAAAGGQHLTPTQRLALWGLVRWPFISAQDLSLGLDGPALGTVYDALAGLRLRTLAEWAPYVSSRAQHERLWYLAEGGVRLAAGLARADPATFARAWCLGETALLRRLGRLEHLTLSRGFLLDLQAACRERRGPGPLVRAWQPWPVRLPYLHGTRRIACLLDGAAMLCWSRHGLESREAEIVLVWDDGSGVALEVLRPRLVALLRAQAAWDEAALRTPALHHSTAAPAPNFPTVLLVATRPERARGAWSLAADVARRERVHPLPLLITSAPSLRTWGPADASWRDQAGREGTLPLLLAPRAVPRRNNAPHVADHVVSALSAASHGAEEPAARGGPLVQGQFARRSLDLLAALGSNTHRKRQPHRPSAGGPRGPQGRHLAYRGQRRPSRGPLSRAERALVALALRPADLRLLHCLGLVPLATHETLATLTGDQVRPASAPARGWTAPRGLARLLRWGLCDFDVPTRITAHAHRRYFLTPCGLAVLAATAGLSPAAYGRLAGAVAGTRAPSLLPARRPRGRPRRATTEAVMDPQAGTRAIRVLRRRTTLRPRRVRLGSYQLSYYRRYADHTQDVQAAFVAFVCAARAAVSAGHDHALEAWHFEWAALRRFPHGGGWQTLRPDTYGRYRVGRRVLAFFLEIDRGTSGLHDQAVKLAAYGAYRDSGLYARDPAYGGLAFPTLLVVTTGEERLRNILALRERVAAERFTRPLVVWVATTSDLAAHGPFGRIWRDAAQHPPVGLEQTLKGRG